MLLLSDPLLYLVKVEFEFKINDVLSNILFLYTKVPVIDGLFLLTPEV